MQLLDRCRKHPLSVLVPMGQEMSYRYQETLTADLVRPLRAFRARIERESSAGRPVGECGSRSPRAGVRLRPELRFTDKSKRRGATTTCEFHPSCRFALTQNGVPG